MHVTRIAVGLALAGVVIMLTGCASRVVSVPLPEPPLPVAVSGEFLTPYPTPQWSELGEYLSPGSDVEFVGPQHALFAELLEEFDVVEAWRELPAEGYVLITTERDARAIVLVGAADDDGARWAERTLEQLTWTDSAGQRWVRDAVIVDYPAFPLRGNKRPRAWELDYGANFAWGSSEAAHFAGRGQVAITAPGSPLDATGAGVRRALDDLIPAIERGVKRVAIKFDDVGFGLTPATRLTYGEYPRALVVYLRDIRRRVHDLDPEITVYYLPQTYWWSDARLVPFARAVRAAGGLPTDVGLVFTGPEIISARIDAEGLVAAVDRFGMTATSPLIYDNRGREGDWGPLDGRDPALADHAAGVFGERGTAVNRLTRLDWSWNPAGYDPERSWRRALLELAGPDAYGALHEACTAFRDGEAVEVVAAAVEQFAAVPIHADGPVPHEDLVDELRRDIERLHRRARSLALWPR